MWRAPGTKARSNALLNAAQRTARFGTLQHHRAAPRMHLSFYKAGREHGTPRRHPGLAAEFVLHISG